MGRLDTSPPSRPKTTPTPEPGPVQSGRASKTTDPPTAGSNLFGIIAVVAGAAALSFALVRFFGAPPAVEQKPDPVAAPAPSPTVTAPPAPTAVPTAAPTVAATAPVATATAAPSAGSPGAPLVLATSDMELPEGVAVAPDRGLLEVELGEARTIYVDGVFIGRGPSRRLLLREGPHEVRVRSDVDGSEVTTSVVIKKARRTRLATTNTK